MDELAEEFGISADQMKELVAYNPSKFDDLVADGLMSLDDKQLRLTEKGFLCARNVAMLLDPALKRGEGVYSKTV
jgi:coproporphyrinogen III oxidase-like Fe-S oxidoreductase